MKTTLLTLAVIGLCTTALLPTLRAADPSASDMKFAKQAAMGGMMEVKAGELAATNAAAADVKDFGAMMVTDHTAANDKLKSICMEQKIEIPSALDEEHQMMLDKLAKLKGADFDKMYVMKMVAGHEKTVALFETESKTGTDADLKAFATETLPTLQAHLEKIKAIQASMK